MAILDVRKSLSISFLSISHRYTTLIFLEIFDKMADVGHFGCPNFTFDHFSGHCRSICNFNFFGIFLTKWLKSAILDVRTFQIDRPFWISEIHFRSQFWPFQIDTEFCFSGGHFECLKITLDRISGHFRLIGHFGCPKFTFNVISGHFRSIRNFIYFFKYLTKWPPAAILDGTTMSIIELVRDIWMSNVCVKFEERSLNPSKVIALIKLRGER